MKTTQFLRSHNRVTTYRANVLSSGSRLKLLLWNLKIYTVGYSFGLYAFIIRLLVGRKAIDMVMDIVGSAAMAEVDRD